MENFVVSARKYRPSIFDEVIGQDSITRTLKNAIRNQQLAHAYLFCGPRGVGKTTCARIFAKTINCFEISGNAEACNSCESCLSFNGSRSYNIHELDAASNNSVDDIRNLIDQVRVPPQVGKYSVYIIDEVHMLSASAFNSFLKTLEEPPAHAIFILATTQKEKIIPTILSRCQIFDFNRIRVPDIMAHLISVAEKEGIEAEPEALNVIARKADGSMRDALSIFDQISSYAGKKINYKMVIENLSVLDYEYHFRLTDAFLRNDLPSALLLFNEIIEHGFDSHHFVVGLAGHFRDLLVCRDPKTIGLLEVADSVARRYIEQTADCTADFLFHALDICNQCDLSYKNSKDQRLHVELALMKLTRLTGITAGTGQQKKLYDGPVRQQEAPTDKVKEGPEKANAETREPHTDKTPPSASAKPPYKPEPGKKEAPAYQSHSLSIKNLINGSVHPGKPEEQLKKENLAEEPSASDTVMDIANLKDAWQRFSESIREEHPRIYSTMKNQTPIVKEGHVVGVTMNNRVQEEEFSRNIKPDLTTFLRKELGNSKISIETYILEEEKDNNNPYTPEEKFEHLSKKNPNLKDLKQEFNLDFE